MAETSEFDQHEVLHTASLLMDAWNRWVTDTPLLKEREDLRQKAEVIADLMYDFYNSVG